MWTTVLALSFAIITLMLLSIGCLSQGRRRRHTRVMAPALPLRGRWLLYFMSLVCFGLVLVLLEQALKSIR